MTDTHIFTSVTIIDVNINITYKVYKNFPGKIYFGDNDKRNALNAIKKNKLLAAII